jgi:hypothetical protein
MKSLKYDVKHELSPMAQQLREAYVSPEHDLQTKFEYYQDYLEHTIELYAEVLSRKQEENKEIKRQVTKNGKFICSQRQENEELKDKIKLLEACREYDASGKNRPEGYIVPNHYTAKRIDELSKH